ncbi:MAG: hypothetical protein ACYTG5_19020 [Planctomycetota bacterium]|jgi:hypothetical protein
MDTATPAQPAEQVAPEPAKKPADLDPTHDIDSLKTSLALIISGVVVFITMWLLYHLFSFVMFEVREGKVREAPTNQLNQLRTYEATMLDAGEASEGMPARMSIEQAMEEIVKK